MLGHDEIHRTITIEVPMPYSIFKASVATLAFTLTASIASAQSGGMDHAAHAAQIAAAKTPAPAGQDAFATISAVIAALEADSTTDWSKVDVEALRQHLIVMNDVTLGARTSQSSVAAGARMDITGDGRVIQSIRTMLRAHAPQLDRTGVYKTGVDDIPGGARLTVTAANASDAKTAAKIRGLGFVGLLTVGAHHAEHHLMLARGMGMDHR